MILDTLPNASRYAGLSPRIALGLDWLARFDPHTADGRYPLDGDDVYALVQSYETLPAAEKKFESHRSYLDIQYLAVGDETIFYAPTAILVPSTTYDSVKDYLLYADPAQAISLLMPPGSFAIFYPPDGHKPGCVNGPACRIKKVVIKARV
jgi:YhcH/YjgK/YiaL family protein